MEDYVKYVPIETHFVWVTDSSGKLYELIGQVPRAGLTEEDLDLPEWVSATRDYCSNDRTERIYVVCTGTLDEFLTVWLSSKMEKASFNIAGLKVY